MIDCFIGWVEELLKKIYMVYGAPLTIAVFSLVLGGR